MSSDTGFSLGQGRREKVRAKRPALCYNYSIPPAKGVDPFAPQEEKEPTVKKVKRESTAGRTRRRKEAEDDY